ncbi:hypothetical protein C8R43DRAFT_1231086 [Mycena crocata]|nr:hypothetical protein C8R43DRAFT_1231086 [Mycena crocata]
MSMISTRAHSDWLPPGGNGWETIQNDKWHTRDNIPVPAEALAPQPDAPIRAAHRARAVSAPAEAPIILLMPREIVDLGEGLAHEPAVLGVPDVDAVPPQIVEEVPIVVPVLFAPDVDVVRPQILQEILIVAPV